MTGKRSAVDGECRVVKRYRWWASNAGEKHKAPAFRRTAGQSRQPQH